MARYPYAYRHRGGMPPAAVAAAAVVVMVAVTHGSASAHPAGGGGSAAPSHAAARAIAYARAQLGKPYLWGGTGPGAYDCSGLVQAAWASAGVSIPRTSQDQFAAGRHVSSPAPGDLVYFAGSDGTVAAPGHVGLVIGGGKMIEAYATGWPIRVSSYGTASSAPGDESPVGFTDPAARP